MLNETSSSPKGIIYLITVNFVKFYFDPKNHSFTQIIIFIFIKWKLLIFKHNFWNFYDKFQIFFSSLFQTLNCKILFSNYYLILIIILNDDTYYLWIMDYWRVERHSFRQLQHSAQYLMVHSRGWLFQTVFIIIRLY